MDRSIRVSGSFLVSIAFMVLILPLRWILAALAAAAFHELCHYVAIRLLAGKPEKIHIGSGSANIQLPQMSRGKELLCALSGPIGGFLLFFLLPVCPRIALCGLFQSLYNLLPIYPLDGGRAVHCLTSMIMKPTYAHWFCSFLQWVCIGAMFAVGLYAAVFLKLGILPLAFATALLIKGKFANYPCKERLLALQ